jgi:hypothetical protein
MAHLEVKRKRKSLWWLWLILVIIVIAAAVYFYQQSRSGRPGVPAGDTSRTTTDTVVTHPAK